MASWLLAAAGGIACSDISAGSSVRVTQLEPMVRHQPLAAAAEAQPVMRSNRLA